MRKILVTAIGVLIVIVFASRAEISTFIFGTVLESRFRAIAEATYEDGIHVALCGAGSPLPDPDRSAPCTLVLAGDKMFLFDAGNTSNIGQMGFSVANLNGVFLTHFHSDHIGDLGEIMMQRWVTGNNKTPLPVYGPKGIETIVAGFNQAYALDSGYRTAHHGEAIAPKSGKGGTAISFTPSGRNLLSLIKDDDLEISAFSVAHQPVVPAVGYLIRYKGRSVVISGDTARSENLVKHAEGVDLLLHEGLSEKLVAVAEESAKNAGNTTLMTIFHDIPDYHTDPEVVARTAAEAGVKYLTFTHIVPMLPLPGMEKTFLGKARDIFDGPIHVGQDGDVFFLPVNGEKISVDNKL